MTIRLQPTLRGLLTLTLTLLCGASGIAHAQAYGGGAAAPQAVAIGSFTSEEECTVYAVTSGEVGAYGQSSAAAAANRYGAAAAASSSFGLYAAWRTELVRDCVNHFAALRQSMEAALAASGRFRVVPTGTRGALVLTGRVSAIGTSNNRSNGGGVDTNSDDASVNVQFTLRDGANVTVHGAIIDKSVNIANSIDTGQIQSSSSNSDRGVYNHLQREAAFAVARSIAFRLDPLVVTDKTDRRVRLNYGPPLLPVGGTVFLTDGAGVSIRGTVSTVAGRDAWIELDRGANLANLPIGSEARFVEADDPAANAESGERPDLPF